MVGVGEATLGPAAISLSSDYFPQAERVTVTSIYSMGIAIGAGFAALLGGFLGQYSWRTAFIFVGFPGVIFAILVFLLREPTRKTVAVAETNYSSSDWKRLMSNKTFALLCVGYALLGLATNNLSIWGRRFIFNITSLTLPG